MTVKIEIIGRSVGSIKFNPEDSDCYINVYDNDGNHIFCQPLIKPDNISFEKLYKLNKYPTILESIYETGYQVGIKKQFGYAREVVAYFLDKNDIDSLKEWCEIK